MATLWRRPSFLCFIAWILLPALAYGKESPRSLIEAEMRPKAVPAEKSPALWGAELTVTSNSIMRRFKERKSQGAEDVDTIEDPVNTVERDRLITGILARCPGCRRDPDADYRAKKFQQALVIRVRDEWSFGVHVDPAVLEAHVPFISLSSWRDRKKELQDIWFDSAFAGRFVTGTMSGNGHLTRDLETGFEGDSLWLRNALVHHWNHPALADRIFDFDPKNAVTLPRMEPEQREARLKWLSLIDSDYLFYLEATEHLLAQPELDLESLRNVILIKPTVNSIMRSYREFHGSTGQDIHDEPVNLEHDNRLEFRGFLNQGSGGEMIDQMTLLEHGTQRVREIDGFIPVDFNAVSHRVIQPQDAIRQFRSFANGLPNDLIRRLLSKPLWKVFEAQRLNKLPNIKIASQGIRGRELKVLMSLAERLDQIMGEPGMEIFDAGSKTGEAQMNAQYLRLKILISTTEAFLNSLPSRLSEKFKQQWQPRLSFLEQEAKRLDRIYEAPTEKAHEQASRLSAAAIVQGHEGLASAYWDAIHREDLWSRRLRNLLEQNPRVPCFADDLLLNWLIQYRKEETGSTSLIGFEDWLLSRSRVEELKAVGDSFAELSKISEILHEFLAGAGLKSTRAPQAILEDSLRDLVTRQITLTPSEAYKILNFPFASTELKTKVWPIHSFPNWGNFKVAQKEYGIDFNLFDPLTQSQILAEAGENNPNDETAPDSAQELLKPEISRHIYEELERMLIQQTAKTGPGSFEVLRILEAQVELPFLGRVALEKLWAEETHPEGSGLRRTQIADAFMKVLQSGELSSDERFKIFDYYFKILKTDHVHLLKDRSLEYYGRFWALLKEGEFLEFRSRWKKNMREMQSQVLELGDNSSGRRWRAVVDFRPGAFRRSELVDHFVESMEIIIGTSTSTDAQSFTGKMLLNDRMFQLKALIRTKNIRNFSDRAWGFFAKMIVRNGERLELNPRKIPNVFWRSFISELGLSLNQVNFNSKSPKSLKAAADSLRNSFSRERLLYPPEFWNLIRHKFEEAQRSDPSNARATAVADALLPFLSIAAEVPKDIQAVRSQWQNTITIERRENIARTNSNQPCGQLLTVLGMAFTAEDFKRMAPYAR